MRWFSYIGIVAVIFGGIGYVVVHNGQRASGAVSPAEIGDFSIMAVDQAAKKELLVASVTNKEPSALVVQEDRSGIPGEVMGSVILPRGVYNKLIVTVEKELEPGSVVYATLYSLSDGAYDARVSVPRMGASGNVATVKIRIIK